MPDRILVAYATRTGTTAEVAAAIGDTLRGRGLSVDVVSVADNPRPENYRAVILGSAVNGGQWLPSAVEFATRQRDALGRVPVAVFSVHIMNAGPDDRSRRKRRAYLDRVRPLVHPVDEAFFLGMGPDPAKDSWLARWIFRRFGGAGEGDCRDWEAIRAWAGSVLQDELRPAAPAAQPVAVGPT